jgi:hypothetical protein
MDSYAAKGVKGDYESRLPRWKGSQPSNSRGECLLPSGCKEDRGNDNNDAVDAAPFCCSA